MNNHTHTICWANLAAFEKKADAEKLCSYLELKGLEAKIYDERRLQNWWFLSLPKVGVRVQVPSRDIYKVIDQVNEDPVVKPMLNSAVHCPSCNSLKVEYPQMTRRFLMPTLIAHFLVMMRIMKHYYYCEDCHFTWTRNRAFNPEMQSKLT